MLSKNKFLLFFIPYIYSILLLTYLFHFELIITSALIITPSLALIYFIDFKKNYLYIIFASYFFFSFIFTFLISTISLAISFVFLYLLINQKIKISSVSKELKIFFILYFISFIISLVFANNKIESLKWLFVISQYLILFIIFTSLFSFNLIENIFMALIPILVFNLLIGFYQLHTFGLTFRIFGNMVNANCFGAYLSFNIFILIYLFSIFKNILIKYFMILLIIVSTIALVFTYSRGAQIGFISALSMYIILKNLKNKKKIIFFFLLSIMICLMIVFAFPQYFARFLNISLSNLSYSELDRLSLWYAGFKLFTDHPIVGIGVNNYQFEYHRYHIASKFIPSLTGNHKHSHNIFLNVLASQGLIGFFAYSVFIYFFLKKIFFFRKSISSDIENELWLFTVCISVYLLIHGLFDVIWTVYPRHYMLILYFLWFSCVNFLYLKYYKSNNEKPYI